MSVHLSHLGSSGGLPQRSTAIEHSPAGFCWRSAANGTLRSQSLAARDRNTGLGSVGCLLENEGLFVEYDAVSVGACDGDERARKSSSDRILRGA